MNNVEDAILKGSRQALNWYEQNSDTWLWHAPESFLQVFVALNLGKRTGNCIYLECSPKRVVKDLGRKLKGRRPHNSRERFDIVVWWKNDRFNGPLAVIEVKRSNSNIGRSLKVDILKMKKYLLQKQSGDKCKGYLLVYSEAKYSSGVKQGRKSYGRKTLIERFDTWATTLEATLVDKTIDTPHGQEPEDRWSRGFALYRVAK